MDHGGIEIGAVLAGKYRVERVLGQGGMGIVVQAMHLQLHQPVAMKFLLSDVLGNQQIVQRFLREAQAAVRLKGEHVAHVIDVGTLETGTPYMVLEYLEGTDFASFPRSQLTVGGTVDLMLQACEALAEAHSLGIVHRDVKPANFFITRRADGTLLLKVLDFGISKSLTASHLTATQTAIGTPAYMSPEQMRSSRDVDHRTDIWSLGVVLYELLQGVPPFGGETFSSMVLTVVNDPLPKLTVRLPGDLESVVYRCLEKDPAKRFQNIAELACALAKYAQSEVQAAISVQRTKGILRPESVVALGPGPAQRVPASTISGSAGAGTVPRRSRGRWPITGLAGTALIGGAIVLIVSRGDDASPQATSPAAAGETADVAPHAQSIAIDAPPSTKGRPAVAAGHNGTATPNAAAAAPLPPAAGPPPPGRPPLMAPAAVSIVIESTPPGAQVFVSSEKTARGTTPYVLELAPTSAPVEIRLARAGYKPMKKTIGPDSDPRLAFALEKATSSSPATVKPAATDPDDRDNTLNPFDKKEGVH